jgi:hypothetical protein
MRTNCTVAAISSGRTCPTSCDAMAKKSRSIIIIMYPGRSPVIKGTPAAGIWWVDAPDAETAIKEVILREQLATCRKTLSQAK